MVTTIPVRSVLERLGYRVDYDENTGIIRITDPATGRTGTISPGSYELRQGRAYINPQYIASWLRPGLPSAAVAAYTMLDQIPSMNEVIAKAQADYEAARSKGDTPTMERAQQVINAARAVGNIIGYDVRPADALNPIKRVPSGGAFFDPIAYMWQAALSLPWAPGTPTMTERELANRLELERMRQQHEKELEQMRQQHEKELESMRQQAKESSMSASEIRAYNKAALMNTLKARLDAFWAGAGPNGPTREEAMKYIYGLELEIRGTNRPILTEKGLTARDLDEVIDHLLASAGITRSEYDDYKKQLTRQAKMEATGSTGVGSFRAMLGE